MAKDGHAAPGNDEANWSGKDERRRGLRGCKSTSDLQLHVGRHNFWILSHSKSNLEQMLQDLIEKVGMWDLVPEPASHWWTSTFEPEESSDLSIDTKSFEEKFQILGCTMNRQGKTHDAIEERMQFANRAYWKDFLVYKSKDIPWMIKCRRLVDHVFAVFSFGNDKLVLDNKDPRKDQGVGVQDNAPSVPLHKTKKKKHWSTIMLEPAKRPGRCGCRCVCPFCMR